MNRQTQSNGVEGIHSIKHLVVRLAHALVEKEDRVELDVWHDADGVTLIPSVAPEDLTRIIGPQGRTIRSLRTVLGAASMKNKQGYSLELRD